MAPPAPDTTSTACLTPYPLTNGVASVAEVNSGVSVDAAAIECDPSAYYTPEEEEVAAEEAGNMDDWVTEFDP